MNDQQHSPAAARVCAIADIECSRDCGTGDCKREREARYPVEQHEAAPANTCAVCHAKPGQWQCPKSTNDLYNPPPDAACRAAKTAPSAPLEGTGNGADERAVATVVNVGPGEQDMEVELLAPLSHGTMLYARAPRAEVAGAVPAAVLDALRFYANGSHFNIDHDHQDFDTVSGEPANWLYSTRDDDTTMIEDGSIAKAALCGKPLAFEDPEQPVDGEVLVAVSADAAAAPVDERAPFDYDDVVSICDAHGIGLPVDCIEMVVEIVRHAAPPAQVATRQGLTEAARDVLAERCRQIEREGWTPAHDDRHDEGDLALAAIVYAESAVGYHASCPDTWPWSPTWFKPATPRRDLVKAGALILAEIERIDRALLEGAKQ
ncbi:hypothetical protein [Burkholderia anthina]|uniref:hypothetical protein n=1 Tax=Burkholderia anthina TaxID=179879 RepID=UPI001588ECB5|nr:hypothetical protein [Burkholderia anthina]